MKRETTFTTADGEKISLTIYGEQAPEQPAIIYVHGFKGFKDWGFVPHLGETLAQRGFSVLTFNFSHNGIGDNPVEFTELHKFADNTFSREVRELSEIIDACRAGAFGSKPSRIGLLGHSRGGGIALLTAPLKPDLAAVVTWSAVATFDRYTEEHQAAWQRDGFIEMVNQRTGQVMKMNKVIFDDLEKHKNGMLNIELAVKNLSCPLLIIHGDKDESVPVDEAKKIHQWANDNTTDLALIGGTGHTFGAVHPFAGSTDALDTVLKKTAAFLSRHMQA